MSQIYCNTSVLYLESRLKYNNIPWTLYPRFSIHLHWDIRIEVNLYMATL